MNTKAFLLLVAFATCAPIAASQAATSTVVKVTLRDATDDPNMKMMEMKADPQTIKAGPVSFEVTNESKSLVHEMIVVAIAQPGEALPYNDKKGEVLESKIKHLGEASDLPAGTKKTLKLNLKPGNYVLICNQPGHYHQGMTTAFTVTQ